MHPKLEYMHLLEQPSANGALLICFSFVPYTHLNPCSPHYYKIGLSSMPFVPVTFGPGTKGGFCPGSNG